jgi:serine/threonine protein phosphatase 1
MFIGEARAPDNMVIYAIGDIHGMDLQLYRALQRIETDLSAEKPKRYAVVFLGDYTDRGPSSKKVIDMLMAFEKRHTNEARFIRGNHDEMLLDALDGFHPEHWLNNGGVETLESYGVDVGLFDFVSDRELMFKSRKFFPQEHIDWLKRTELYVKIRDYLFVHAGIQPGVPLEEQNKNSLLWIRDPFLLSQADHGFVVVHGHTPRKIPTVAGNRIGIDTGAVFFNTELTVLKLKDNSWGWI